MVLFIGNDIVKELLTMDNTMLCLEKTYRDLVTNDAVCRPRIDIQVPTGEFGKVFQWGTMEGGSASMTYRIFRTSD